MPGVTLVVINGGEGAPDRGPGESFYKLEGPQTLDLPPTEDIMKAPPMGANVRMMLEGKVVKSDKNGISILVSSLQDPNFDAEKAYADMVLED